MKQFDVVVIGGGHAGTEAAHAAARLGASTALVTMSEQTIGVMSCNPAIGGLGKGHLVREIDAFDGLMGRIADLSGIQFRLLNRRKGPAVQGPRAQSDREVYRLHMLSEIRRQKNLTILSGEVVDFVMQGDRVCGVFLADGSEIRAGASVLTTGTFLRGVIHIGDTSYGGGRMGDKASVKLADRVDSFGLAMGRLKTGTPPRIDGRSIRWDALEMQPGDEDPVLFSFLSAKPALKQVACGITHTNEGTHDIIRKNLEKSAMYGGHIDGVGPRYCPSIEDKIVRFADKTSHQIFLEPEGLSTNTVYPNGISTSLPAKVQEDYVHSIVGLEDARIEQPGYAIEYDYVDPRSLDGRLQVRGIPGLFFAGQINGTTGYEEAAAQGLVAGLNAALEVKDRDSLLFSRTNSYVGVMIDDLTTRGVAEPYRMFTSRAEFRLSLRADNADQRLTPCAISVGCISVGRKEAFESKMERLENARLLVCEKTFTPSEASAAGISVGQDGTRRTAFQLLSFPGVSFDQIAKLESGVSEIGEEERAQLSREAIYANYIERQNRDIAVLQKDEAIAIPSDLDFEFMTGLSNELSSKLMLARPSTLAQAARIDGMTPAALTLILARIRQHSRQRSA